jgi:putative glutathione S-transferase
LFNSQFLHQLYFRDDPAYKGKYSVPLLWDTKTNLAVNNESAEMLRWLPTTFPNAEAQDFYPPSLRSKIDEITPWLTNLICTGVYKAGFATSQATYESNVIPLFAALNKLEQLIHKNNGPYILGQTLTELDLLAYPTIIRFDTVYAQHFKTNLGSVRHDYPVLNNWLKGLYWNVQGFKESTDFRHIKENVRVLYTAGVGRGIECRQLTCGQYTKSHHDINPLSITPLGPWPDVEDGYEKDWSKLVPGRVKHPRVLEAEKEL